jgi:hypothetical protein
MELLGKVPVKKAEIAAENNEESASESRTFPKTFELLEELEKKAARRAEEFLAKNNRKSICAVKIVEVVV